MARDTIKVITFLIFGCMYVTASATGFYKHHKGVYVCVCVCLCVYALGVGESWQQAWGRMQRDEAFLIKRKYLCLHTIPVGTWDNSENSGSLIAHSLK